MDLQDFLAAVAAPEGLRPGQGVDLHHDLLLLTVAEESVFHVINLWGPKPNRSWLVSRAVRWGSRLVLGAWPLMWDTLPWDWLLPLAPALSQDNHLDSAR